MLILIDDREYQSGVADWLRQEENVAVRQQRLPVGDYIVNNHLIFERKTLPDFAASIRDGRLFLQMQRLIDAGKKCALLLEGTSKDLTGSQMRREALQGALVHISLFMNIPILRTVDTRETAKIMLYAARQAETTEERKNITIKRPQPQRIKSKQKRQLYLLQGLPGIGPVRARTLLEKFGSIEGVLLATQEELSHVPGIGSTTAQNIQWILKENDITYGSWFPDI